MNLLEVTNNFNHAAPTNTAPTTPAVSQPERTSRRKAGRRLLVVGVLLILALIGAFVLGTWPRLRAEGEVNALAAEAAAARPRVTVATAYRTGPDSERVLIGSALPLLEASLFARTTGYLKTRLVDIGDHVKEGQLLADISAPDVDDQLNQAKANVAQAQANLKLAEASSELAQVTLDRDLRTGPNNIAPLTLDQDRAQVRTTKAQVEATRASIKVNQAAVQRFQDLQDFQKIIAPFPGVITARNVDPGDLVSADSPTSRELFHLMRTDILRVFVDVPQVFATGIKVGQEAVVYRREEPGRQFAGKVTRTANALDANTRTLRTEVQVPNPADALRPGMFLQVRFVFRNETLPVRIPSAAVVTRNDGSAVAVLDGGQTARYRKVTLGRDYGAEVEVVSGLNGGETVLIHPGDDLPEGTPVDPVPGK
jgi:RND family efflux transporter MFP subunit